VEHLIGAEVRMISGCHSEQTSADVVRAGGSSWLPNPNGKAGGACTSALLDILYQHQHANHGPASPITFQQVLLKLRSTLEQRGFDQIPQLTSSRPLEVQEIPFTCLSPSRQSHSQARALLVGINYHGQSGELAGCHNDVFRMRDYLLQVQGYAAENIVIIVDNGRHHYPNRENIIKVLQQLVAQSRPGDSVFFHYSGHGGLLDSLGNPWKQSVGQEYDEILYPLDHQKAGHIRDYSLFKNFVQPMPAGVTVTCIMDCCHSGSVLDLPYSYKPTPGGTIAMQRNMGSLHNLALLYLLAGGRFPGGGLFDNVSHSIQGVTGQSVDSLQGAGMGEQGETTYDGGDMGDYVGNDQTNDIVDDGDVDVADNVDVDQSAGEGIDSGDVPDFDASGARSDFPEPIPPPAEPPIFDTNGNPCDHGPMEVPDGVSPGPPIFDTSGNPIDPGLMGLPDDMPPPPPILDTSGNEIGDVVAVEPPVIPTYDATEQVGGYGDMSGVPTYANGGGGYFSAPAADVPTYDAQGVDYGYSGNDDGAGFGMGGYADNDYGGGDDCNDCGGCLSDILQNLGDDEG